MNHAIHITVINEFWQIRVNTPGRCWGRVRPLCYYKPFCLHWPGCRNQWICTERDGPARTLCQLHIGIASSQVSSDNKDGPRKTPGWRHRHLILITDLGMWQQQKPSNDDLLSDSFLPSCFVIPLEVGLKLLPLKGGFSGSKDILKL